MLDDHGDAAVQVERKNEGLGLTWLWWDNSERNLIPSMSEHDIFLFCGGFSLLLKVLAPEAQKKLFH